METSDPSQRGVYFPMELLPRDILNRLGNVRVLVVPKERSSSCKENEEECFGKTEDRTLFEGPPLSPGVNYRPMGQSFDFRLTSPDGERYPMKERQEAEMMKGLTETTPKRRPQEPAKTPARFENNMADDNLKSTNQSSPCIPDGSLPSDIGVQAKIKRQLFSNFEADFRAMRSESESLDEVFVERHREADKMAMYYSMRDKQSPSHNVSKNIFDRDFAASSGWRSCPPLSPYLNQSRFDFSEYRMRQMGVRCEAAETSSKRKFGEMSSLENTIQEVPKKKKSGCTCSSMEQNFLQMAECAYKNIRRKDTSPSSFDQFRRELIQTNNILKESVNIVATIRDMCEHNRQMLR